MKFKKIILIFLLITAGEIFSQTMNIYPDPAVYYKSIGDTAFVVFKVSNAYLVHSSSVTVMFNNSLVKYLGATNGSFYPGGSFFGTQPSTPLVMDRVTVDNAILGQSSVSGNGTMFTLRFKALANGYCPVNIINLEVRTTDNQERTCTSQNGGILIGGITANIKVFLQGPFNTGNNLMNTSLNTSGYLPSNQPYNVAPWNYTGTESVTPSFFASNTNIVDWVLVELRTGTAGNTMVTRKAALLRNDGHIVDYRNSSSPIVFEGLSAGNYYVIVRHRNHLGIMSAIAISLSQTSSLYDFSTGLNKYYGNDAKLITGSVYGMYLGDENRDGFITGTDFNNFLIDFRAGNYGYKSTDFNLDVFVTGTDFNDFILNFRSGPYSNIPN